MKIAVLKVGLLRKTLLFKPLFFLSLFHPKKKIIFKQILDFLWTEQHHRGVGNGWKRTETPLASNTRKVLGYWHSTTFSWGIRTWYPSSAKVFSKVFSHRHSVLPRCSFTKPGLSASCLLFDTTRNDPPLPAARCSRSSATTVSPVWDG